MPARALLFDLDGTLVDTNAIHSESFQHAFLKQGFRVNPDRLAVEMGQGADHLVPSILGTLAWHTYGKRITDAYNAEFARICESTRIRIYPQVEALLQESRARGLRLALATGSSTEQLDLIFDSAKTDLRSHFDVVTTANDVDHSKPNCDVFVVAAEKLGLHPAQCIAVGDTRFDIEAAHRAGMTSIAMVTGPKAPNPRPTPRGGDATGLRFPTGSRRRYPGPAELLAQLTEALQACLPLTFDLTPSRMAELLAPAFDAARRNLEDGGAPIGAALFAADGTLICAGANQTHKTGNGLHHAEIVVLDRATGRFDPAAKSTLLVSTLEPCVMCTGAAMEVGIDTMVYALSAPADAGSSRVAPPSSPESTSPRSVGGFRADESLALFRDYLRRNPPEAQAAFARQLLALHDA